MILAALIAFWILFIGIILFKPLWIMNYLLSPMGAMFAGIKRIKNLQYGQDVRQCMDVYLPIEYSADTPWAMFVHGGAWDTGHKNEYAFAGRALAELGFACAVPTYRLYPAVKYPHFIEDIAEAVRRLPSLLDEKSIESQGLRKHGFVMMGHSAGAHTGAMLSTHEQYLQESDTFIHQFIGMAGPYDLPLDDPLVVGKFDGVRVYDVSEMREDYGHEHNAHEANPINWAHENMPPCLLIHGADDVTVGPYHSERFSRRLEQLKVKHDCIMLEEVNHRHLVGALCYGLRWLNPAYDMISDTLRTIKH